LGLIGSLGLAADAKSPAAKGTSYSARLASLTPSAGYDEAVFGSSTIFVASNAALGAGEIVAARVNASDIVLTLTADGATKAATLVRSHSGARLAVFDAERVVGAPVIDSAMLKGTSLTISTAAITPTGPAINVVASKATAAPGELVTFDVFVSPVADLKGYQVALEAWGGDSGKLTLIDIHQDTQRADFVYGSEQILNAVDLNGSRMVAALFTGSTDVTTPKYLGTYTFQSTPDARGTFNVRVQVSDETMLRNSQNTPIAYQAGTPGTIRVGATK
jgi:hypothetical protein